MAKFLVIHHNDMDGIASAAIVKHFEKGEFEFVSAQYGTDVLKDFKQNIENKEFDKVYVVDFSFDMPTMEWLNSHSKLVWLDHHKTSFEAAKNANFDCQGMHTPGGALAGCGLTWMFFTKEPMPSVIKYVNDWDTWTFNYRETKPFYEAMCLETDHPADLIWKELLSKETEERTSVEKELLREGAVLILAKNKRIEKTFKEGKEMLWHLHPKLFKKPPRVLVVNTNHDISDVGNYIYLRGYDIAFIWRMVGDKVIVSLRSKNLDVSEIAKTYGGGGHKAAAAFELSSIYELWTLLSVKEV